MGLLQKACETYDAHIRYVGLIRDGHEVLAPISHIVTTSHIEITINQAGEFVRAVSVDKREPKIIIPVTEDSAGRTGKSNRPHPLCDQLKYLATYDKAKYDKYVEQLTDWVNSPFGHPKLPPVLNYIKKGTILSDLEQAGILRLNENGRPAKEDQEKFLVRWRITGLDEQFSGPCWTDSSLFQAFIDYYNSQKQNAVPVLCMVSGKTEAPAKQHPKGIIPINGNAKLISANDTTNFTYLGRFSDAQQTATVSYTVSQKAHNALRWIAAEQGVRAAYGGRTFLCWNPQGKPVGSVIGPFSHKSASVIISPTEYKTQLYNTLVSFKKDNQLTGNEVAVIAAFDAANKGRLALTYYNELSESDFLRRLHDWDATCCWYNGHWGIQSPPLWQIVDCAFGSQQTEKGTVILKTDDRIMRQQLQRLLSCRVDQVKIPIDIENILVQRASSLISYELSIRRKLLFTACAVVYKYYHDYYKEDYGMSLDPAKRDRSYQYGRLLAVFEKAEQDTYNKEETRETNAIRMQAIFSQRPLHASRIIWEQLKTAYYPKLKSTGDRKFYDNLISEIFEVIHLFPEAEWDQPLKDTYLIGYSLQRNELYKPRDKKNMEEKD